MLTSRPMLLTLQQHAPSYVSARLRRQHNGRNPTTDASSPTVLRRFTRVPKIGFCIKTFLCSCFMERKMFIGWGVWQLGLGRTLKNHRWGRRKKFHFPASIVCASDTVHVVPLYVTEGSPSPQEPIKLKSGHWWRATD